MVNTGYLLSYVKYGDNDAILHCFTREEGFRSYFMKGVYSPKNKKKAYLAPLNEITFSVNDFYKSGITNIKKIEQVKTLDCYTDIRASSIVFFIAEFLYQILKKELKQDKIYQAIQEFLRSLEEKNFQCHFSFLIDFLKIQGLAPLLSEGKCLNPEAGCFELVETHRLFNEEISSKWRDFVANENIYSIRVKSVLKEDFLESILWYYRCHFPEFKVPKSLDILKQIFAD